MLNNNPRDQEQTAAGIAFYLKLLLNETTCSLIEMDWPAEIYRPAVIDCRQINASAL